MGMTRHSVEGTFLPFQKSGGFFRIFGDFSELKAQKTTGRFPSLPFKLTELKRYSTT